MSCGVPSHEREYKNEYARAYREAHPGKRRAYDQARRAAGIGQRRLSAELTRSAVATLKVESGCVDCGYNEDPIALEFDHLGGKLAGVGKMMGHNAPIERVLEEIDKCEVRCSNCHQIKTVERRLACHA